MKQYLKYSVPAKGIVDSLKKCGIEYVTTVPDMVQIALHQMLDSGKSGLRVIHCTTEDQAVEVAGGLYAGGKNAAVIVQNQGLYACINSLRALGLDSRIPMLFVIGQFGREFSNLGHDPNNSKRRVVFLLEPLLNTLGIPFWRVERSEDLPNIEKAWEAAIKQSVPSAVILGHFVAW